MNEKHPFRFIVDGHIPRLIMTNHPNDDAESRHDLTDPLAQSVQRYANACWLGMLADDLFEIECRRRGMTMQQCLAAPLEWLASALGTESVN